MATSQIELNTYHCLTEACPAADEPAKSAGFPTLFWAGAILFAVNVIIAAAVWISPPLQVGLYGEELKHTAVTYKPSPFTEVVATKAPKKVRQAVRLTPVVFEQSTPAQEYLEPHAVVEAINDFPRRTASLTPASAQAPVARTSVTEVSPRRVSERELLQLVAN